MRRKDVIKLAVYALAASVIDTGRSFLHFQHADLLIFAAVFFCGRWSATEATNDE